MRIEDIANPLISDPEQVGADNFQKLFSAIPQTAQQVATDKPQDLTRTISLNLKDIGQLDYQEQQDKKDRDKPDDAVSTYLQTIGLAGGIANAPVKLQTVTPNIASYSTTSQPVQVASLTNIRATDAATGVATGVSGTDLLSTDAFTPKLTDIDDPMISSETAAAAEKGIDLLSGEKADDLITKGLSKVGVSNQPFTSVGSYQFPGYTATSSYTAPNMGMVPKNQYVATTATGQLAATGSAALGAIGAAQALKGGIDSPKKLFNLALAR